MATARRPETGESLQAAAPKRERQPGLRAVGVAAGRLAGPIIARNGGGTLARLKAQWTAIAGPELAAASWPETLARGGTLKLRVAPTAALEIQHRTPLVIDRINLFLGHGTVARLTLVQGPLPLPATPSRPVPAELPAATASALDAELAGISDAELRAALTRLGRAVAAAARD